MLTERFQRALVFAAQRHDGQHRQGSAIPYISHLLSTSALILESGGDEDQAIAGLLHDSIEDGKASYDDIYDRFGHQVAELVLACSEPGASQGTSWRERKEAYLAVLRFQHPSAALVANADKLDNARSLLYDYRRLGNGLWARFKSDAEPLWYFRSLAELFLERDSHSALAKELDRTVRDLERLVAEA
jgi:(p)ppGpp synthase/HD superfamily hydrolase